MRLSTATIALVVTLCVTATVGCAQAGSSSTKSSASLPVTVSLLATSPTPGLAATTIDVTPQTVQSDLTVKGVVSQLTTAGFLIGRQRTFQGPSKDLTLIRDRELVFASADGATKYLESIRANATAYFGEATGVTPLVHGSRAGSLFVPAQCACHGANPVLTAVLANGSQLSWVTINGPMATKKRLQEVLSQPTQP